MSQPKGQNNPRYKTIMCKHFGTPQGCSYGNKCQFAHGKNELRLNNNQTGAVNAFPMMNMMGGFNKNQAKNIQNSVLNYKIVKCKNYERDKTCKYGVHCTFAHGDSDLRSKNDNLCQMNAPCPIMMPMIYDINSMPVVMGPQGMDMTQMQLMPGGFNQGQMMMGFDMMGAQNQGASQVGIGDKKGEKNEGGDNKGGQ